VTYTAATADTLHADQSISVTGDAKLHLEGEEGDIKAGLYASVERGTLNTKSGS
jgi:hypothetical protein